MIHPPRPLSLAARLPVRTVGTGLAAALLALTAGATSVARAGDREAPNLLEVALARLDRDGDGHVTEAETVAAAGALFDELDQATSGDGRLTRDEMLSGLRRVLPWIPSDAADEDDLTGVFRALDRDGDGRLALAEIPAEHRTVVAEAARARGLGQGPFDLETFRTIAASLPEDRPPASLEEAFRILDANGDGLLDRREASRFEDARRRFVPILDRLGLDALSLPDLAQAAERFGLDPRGGGAEGDRAPAGASPLRERAATSAMSTFEELDGNGDGVVDLDEVPAELGDRYRAALEHAGRTIEEGLTRSELEQHLRGR